MSESKIKNTSSLELPEVNWLDRDSNPKRFFKDLSYALSEFGFMVLTNAPGFSDDFQQNAFHEVRGFFESSRELKKTAYIAKTPYFRGYSLPNPAVGNFGQVNYGAAKEGIAGFTRSLALEVAKYKCTVNTISPGAATRLTIDLIEAAGRKYDENDWTQGPGQIAPVVAWLCTEEASEVTSQIIHSQGGILGIMQQPAIIQSFTTDNLWTLEQLDKLIPELVETRKFHDQEVEEKGAPKKV